MFEKLFKLEQHNTTKKTEISAGIIGFFTTVYIVIVNSAILTDAGIPYQGAVFATVFVTVIGCLVMGLGSNAPIILMPGMGVNAFFTYNIVQGMGLTWQSALGVVLVTGLIFLFLTFTPCIRIINESVPFSLKQGITIGLGLFLVLTGLENGGIVQQGTHSLLEFGDLHSPLAICTIITLLFALVLEVKKVSGTFLWIILAGTGIGIVAGVSKFEILSAKDILSNHVMLHSDFSQIGTITFWLAVFNLLMIVLFETIGIIYGQVRSLERESAFPSILRSASIGVVLSSLLGTSPTVPAIESESIIKSGGKTGLASSTTAVLFLSTLLATPLLKLIPMSAVAPVLVLIGLSMFKEFRHLEYKNDAELYAALMIILFIPFTGSIADGIAVGFIAYPILTIFTKEKTSMSMVIISLLFLLMFIVKNLLII